MKSKEKYWIKFRCLDDNFRWLAPLVADKYSNHQIAWFIGSSFIPIFINWDNSLIFFINLQSDEIWVSTYHRNIK